MAEKDVGTVLPGMAPADEAVALRNGLALEQAKNGVLCAQLLKAESALAERDLTDFADVVPNEDREFWRGQLLENRDAAVGMLERFRNRARPAAAAVPPVAAAPAVPKPLHNRETAKPAVAEKGGGEGPAAKVRNRAQEIAQAEKCSFTVAFRRAEAELGQ